MHEHSPSVVLTLVHGTWGQGFWAKRTPRWFEDGSEFRKRLEAAMRDHHLTCRFEKFLWSGDNSIKAREIAASKLQEALRAQVSNYKASRLVVVAHSHGGEVAARAVERFEGTSDKILIVSLATPFLSFRTSQLTDLSSKTSEYFDAFINILGMFVMMATAAFATRFALWNPFVGIPLFLVALFLGLWLWSRLMEKVVVGNIESSYAYLKPDRALPPLSILVLRAVRDEATIALQLSVIGSAVTNWVFWFYGVLIYNAWKIFLAILAFYFFIIFAQTYSKVVTLIGEVVFFLVLVGGAALFFLSPVVMAMAFICAAICKCVNGRELLWGGLMYDVQVKDVPDHKGGMLERIVLCESKAGGLRHSLYKHEQCPSAIATFVATRWCVYA